MFCREQVDSTIRECTRRYIMFMFMFMLSHVIPYAKHPLEIPPFFSLRIFFSDSDV